MLRNGCFLQIDHKTDTLQKMPKDYTVQEKNVIAGCNDHRIFFCQREMIIFYSNSMKKNTQFTAKRIPYRKK